jgi:hypothetical protein
MIAWYRCPACGVSWPVPAWRGCPGCRVPFALPPMRPLPPREPLPVGTATQPRLFEVPA